MTRDPAPYYTALRRLMAAQDRAYHQRGICWEWLMCGLAVRRVHRLLDRLDAEPRSA